ncbi:siderophore-interacting protein [Sphaerotilus sp.]|uniref:siderophore-interacting protein n=1 Tax=Sphaerotilus sp. TaxID=2093942 RepID=UPI002ACD9F6F|nr:siderophore-interacting protein [Sphaerotilus sp.]MDZ7858864.1 siderophore-interacting protein [Sphaerotilus sp.]
MTLALDRSPAHRIQRVRHELRRRDLTVLCVDTPSPGFRRITFTGSDLAGFTSASFDDHIKLVLDAADGGEPVRRDYTPRHYDAAAGTLAIEFALHGDGPAAAWAAQATPGQRATIGGPRGSFIIPTDADWHLLVGDDTALPAVARRLEELPASARAFAVLHVADAADRRALPSAASVQVQWVDSGAALADAVRALDLPGGEGFAWGAGEAGAMAAVRRVLVDERGLDRQAVRVSAYWKQGAAAHHEHIET